MSNPKLLVLDGVDNTGKSWLVSELAKLFPEAGTCAFPSIDLVNSGIFKLLLTDPTPTNKLNWVQELIAEEEKTLLALLSKHDLIIVDRMWLSTLIYQGSGKNDNFVFETEINRYYIELFKRLDIGPWSVHHAIPLIPLTDDPNESNPNKLEFDRKRWLLLSKLVDLLWALERKNSNVYNEYLQNISVANESCLISNALHRTSAELEIISAVQRNRLMELRILIEPNLSGKQLAFSAGLRRWEYNWFMHTKSFSHKM